MHFSLQSALVVSFRSKREINLSRLLIKNGIKNALYARLAICPYKVVLLLKDLSRIVENTRINFIVSCLVVLFNNFIIDPYVGQLI